MPTRVLVKPVGGGWYWVTLDRPERWVASGGGRTEAEAVADATFWIGEEDLTGIERES